MVAPTAISFHAPKNYLYSRRSERAFLQEINDAVGNSVETVDVLAALDEQQGEYLYFKTDHHWTARGAYWAYAAFAELSGLAPVALEAMTKLPEQQFLGSLYGITRASELRVS